MVSITIVVPTTNVLSCYLSHQTTSAQVRSGVFMLVPTIFVRIYYTALSPSVPKNTVLTGSIGVTLIELVAVAVSMLLCVSSSVE